MSGNIPHDPCGHTKIAVSDFKKSFSFYEDIFKVLKYKLITRKNDHASWASPAGYGIIIAQARIPRYKYQFGSPGLFHICFKAMSKRMVDEAYQIATVRSVHIFTAPQKRPEFTSKWYAITFADPDGIKLEVAYY